MTGHAGCRRATWAPANDPRSPFTGEWRCYHCRELLALTTRLGQANVDGRLIESATRVDGLTTFGLPDKYRMPSRARIPRSASYLGPHDVPLAIYCPRPGVCGRVQHLHLDSDGSARLP